MKTNEVPQDDANMLQGKFKEPVYSLNDDGSFTTVPSVGWDPKNEVMQEAWDRVNERVEEARQQVVAGHKSPILYYLEKNIMDIGLVAKYMGLRRWTVRRHLKPARFNKLSDELLERYAGVFNITKAQLTDIHLLKKED